MTRWLRAFYLGYFSQPRGLRPLYRLLRKRAKPGRKNPGGPICKITELGVGPAERTLRMLELCPADDRTQYVGIDLFEARQNGDGPGLKLKEAHQRLAGTGVKVKLIPGDPYSALARSANSLGGQDLILIGADQDRTALAKAWFYVPRMMHEQTVVFEESLVDGEPVLAMVPHDEIARRAAAATPGRRAA